MIIITDLFNHSLHLGLIGFCFFKTVSYCFNLNACLFNSFVKVWWTPATRLSVFIILFFPSTSDQVLRSVLKVIFSLFGFSRKRRTATLDDFMLDMEYIRWMMGTKIFFDMMKNPFSFIACRLNDLYRKILCSIFHALSPFRGFPTVGVLLQYDVVGVRLYGNQAGLRMKCFILANRNLFMRHLFGKTALFLFVKRYDASLQFTRNLVLGSIWRGNESIQTG